MDYEKWGYLHDEFRLFHIADCEQKEYAYHYHDFYKVLILLSGNVSYTIEGRTYRLAPFDIVFVNTGEIHRPVVHDKSPYERIILYIAPELFSSLKTEEYDLEYCFRKAKEEHSNVLRIPGFAQSVLYQKVRELPACEKDTDFAHDLRRRICFLDFCIELNRAALHEHVQYMEVLSSNEKIMQVLSYIRSNLTEDITPDAIADAFYLNKYYLMHLFKAETGYTLGSYITNKRLLYARELLQRDMPATRVCYDCGFKNYSTFSRAYKKQFHEIPTRAKKRPSVDGRLL